MTGLIFVVQACATESVMKSNFKSFLYLSLILIFVALPSYSQDLVSVDRLWNEGIEVPVGGRANILNLDPVNQANYIRRGKLHAQIYPVDVTAALPPLRPLENFFESRGSNPFQLILKFLGESFTGIHSMDDLTSNLGLHPYPAATDTGVYSVPYPSTDRPDYRLGFGVIPRSGVDGFTFSCAACHSGNLFGKTVLGLPNRFPHANEYFVKMIDLSPKLKPLIGTWIFQQATKATPAENKLFLDTLTALDQVVAVKPIAVGLDTTFAQISLSLNKRNDDEWATTNKTKQLFPDKDVFFPVHPADSKPGVWWTTKYKNRWLSDGSIVSGNPIITNLLWNEIGRGTDLKILNQWIQNNPQKIDELSAMVFASESPRFTDFFTENQIDVLSAKRGEGLFNTTCAKCHGQYEKAWSQPGSEKLSITEQIRTTQVNYPKKTEVMDVGTDPNRYLGMKSLEKLNNLRITRDYGIRHVAQVGYVPPPLEGIWARWPYFHNNAAPTLCAVLTATASRPKTYYAGEANSPTRDFDADCNGYPTGDMIPPEWKTANMLYDTSKEGLHNTGHDERIFIKNGVEILSAADKKDLIRFLQTL